MSPTPSPWGTADTTPEGPRIAVISTPRSGNTWVREMIGRLAGLPQIAVHSLTDDDWQRLPAGCVLQLHWRREPAFLERLRAGGFRVVTVARHPLDVLVSILHFAHHSDTAPWLLGEGGDERRLYGLSPRSGPFREYAAGPRGQALLAVTPGWWDRPGVLSLRYEDLVADPAGELARATAALGLSPTTPIAEVVEQTTLRRLALASVNNHFWLGRPGLWRELIPAREARELARIVCGPLGVLGYTASPDPDLTSEQADTNWNHCFGTELVATIRQSLQTHQEQLRVLTESLAVACAERDALREELQQSRDETERLRGWLRGVSGLGRSSLAVARGVQRVVDRLKG